MTSTKKFLAALALTCAAVATGASLGEIPIGHLGGGAPAGTEILSLDVVSAGTDGAPDDAIGHLGGGREAGTPDDLIGHLGGGRATDAPDDAIGHLGGG
jgi:hypothetical protein